MLTQQQASLIHDPCMTNEKNPENADKDGYF